MNQKSKKAIKPKQRPETDRKQLRDEINTQYKNTMTYLDDDFAERLLAREGSIDRNMDFGIDRPAFEKEGDPKFSWPAEFVPSADLPKAPQRLEKESGIPARHEDDERIALLKAAGNNGYSADLLAQVEIDVRGKTVEMLGSPKVLGRPILSDEDLVEAIAAGFPSDVLDALSGSGLPPAALEQVIAPKQTLMRLKAGKQRLTRGESDAVWRLANAYALASHVFSGPESAIVWLSRPKNVLQGRTPLDLLESSVGTSYVNRVLYQLEWGDVA